MMTEVRIDCQPVLRAKIPGLGHVTVLLEVESFMEHFSERYTYDVLIQAQTPEGSERAYEYFSTKVYSSRCGWSENTQHKETWSAGRRLRPNGRAAMLIAAREGIKEFQKVVSARIQSN